MPAAPPVPRHLPQRYEPEVPLARLTPHPANPNEGDQGLLCELLDANGFAGAVLAQESTGLLIDGETRWRAARARGLASLPVIWVDVDDDGRDRLLASLNEATRRGRNDEAKLVALLQGLAVTERGLAGAAFDGDQLDALIAGLGSSGGTGLGGEPDESPDTPADPVTAPGDLWQLGPHRVYCGDTTVPADVRALTGGKRAAMVLTDPPYAIYGSSTGVQSDVADDKMVRPFFEAMWRVIEANLAQFGHAYVHCDWRSWASLWETAKRARMTPRNMIVWDKGGFGLGSNYANSHELVAFFARLPKAHMTAGRDRGQRSVHASNVMRHPRPTGENRLHHAAKPVALLRDLITNSSDPGGTVLDLYAGSGSTLIAAHAENRVAWCMEMEPAMCDVIAARFERLTGIKPERVRADAAPEPVTFAEPA